MLPANGGEGVVYDNHFRREMHPVDLDRACRFVACSNRLCERQRGHGGSNLPGQGKGRENIGSLGRRAVCGVSERVEGIEKGTAAPGRAYDYGAAGWLSGFRSASDVAAG